MQKTFHSPSRRVFFNDISLVDLHFFSTGHLLGLFGTLPRTITPLSPAGPGLGATAYPALPWAAGHGAWGLVLP